jgi:predicted NUDIX family NTP pyrophosphohydrolase
MEETGVALSGLLYPLGEIRQRGGKRVIAFAVEGDVDVRTIRSNTFEIEWPPKGDGCRVFPRSIAPNGSTCHRPMQRFSKVSGHFSIGLPDS